MPLPRSFARLLCLVTACLAAPLAIASKQTVCTITINSADEQKVFRKFLPEDKYQFVELVERNRKDWLASACQAKVSCDVLVISGHYGEGNQFFSDQMEVRESLAIGELERVSCSDSCPGLFAQLKEVYLFGCDTLNPHAQRTVSPEVVRSLVREGRSPVEAVKFAQQLGAERGQSSRDRMRLVFKDVPVIYGFSSVAPLGPVAATSLNRFFQTSGAAEVGKGRPSGNLLKQFSAHGLASARGMAAGDPLQPMRQDVCMFQNDKLSDAQRLAGIHELLRRPAAEARMILDRIEGQMVALTASKRQQPEVAQALEKITRDTDARQRFLAFARDADEADTRARMIQVAHGLGWLSADERRKELVDMLADVLARKSIVPTDVDLACAVNKDRGLDGALDRAKLPPVAADDVGRSAILACVGSGDAHARVLKGLASPSDADVRLAQVYLRHRPIEDAKELRMVTAAIASMSASEAQARALDVLARHYVSDRQSVDTLKQLFARTRSWPVQNAIAGVLIRADADTVDRDLLRTLREYRLKSSPGDNMVDALIQRLQLS